MAAIPTEPLSGTGTAAVVSLPTTLPFGSVPVNPASSQATLNVMNTGDISLNFTSIGVCGTNSNDFVIAEGTCGVATPVTVDTSCTRPNATWQV